MPRVAVVFTGGTISMRHDPAAGGPIPVLRGADILARTGGLEAIADVEAVDWGLVPASHLTLDRVLELAAVVRSRLERPGVEGAVLVQGTDTIEETAFALDLVHGSEKPLVVTGAMRNAGDDGYDGPSNLRGAVRCAAEPALRGQGVLVVMAGEIHAADAVVKTHTDAIAAFRSPDLGPLGFVADAAVADAAVTGAAVAVLRPRGRRRVLHRVPDRAAEPVVLVTAVSGGDGELVRLAARASARGFVVAATGAGNTAPDLLDACREAMRDGLPVVLASRCPAGAARPLYGFPGGGRAWAAAGAIFAGHLHPLKARVAVALGLGAGLDCDGIRALLEE
jgi:L-asparaginase